MPPACPERIVVMRPTTQPVENDGDPGGTPTPDLGFRKALLYAAELRGHLGSSLAGRGGEGKTGAVEFDPGKKLLAINPR